MVRIRSQTGVTRNTWYCVNKKTLYLAVSLADLLEFS